MIESHDLYTPILTEEEKRACYIEQFPHALMHRAGAALRPCGHVACDPHTITYFGTGAANDQREGDYCMVCYERTFPGMCPDVVLRNAITTPPTSEPR